MGKGSNVVYGSGLIDLCLFFDGRGHVVDAAHGWNDPDFIADTDLPVASFVTVKEAFFCGEKFRSLLVIRIGEKLSQACLHIMCMDPGACGNVLFGQSDRRAVLDNGLPCPDVLQGKLVALGYIF